MPDLVLACACNKKYRVAEENAGRKMKCQSCGRILTIPHKAPSEKAPSPTPHGLDDLLDEPLRAGSPSPAGRTSVLPTVRQKEAALSPAKEKVRAELKAIQSQMTSSAQEMLTLANAGHSQAGQASTMEARAADRTQPRTKLGTVAGYAVGGPAGWLVGAAVGSMFAQKGKMTTDERAIHSAATQDAHVFLGAASHLRGSVKSMQRRQSALEAVLSGKGSLVAWVFSFGGLLTAALLFVSLSLLAMVCALVHPVLGVLFLPLPAIVPWVWWRSEVHPLACVLRDHPAAYRDHGGAFPRSLLYPFTCAAVILLGAGLAIAPMYLLIVYLRGLAGA